MLMGMEEMEAVAMLVASVVKVSEELMILKVASSLSVKERGRKRLF
jgi:hypothetical protein